VTIIIEIKAEVQAELSRQAAAHGVDIGAYAASLLEEAAHVSSGMKKLSQSQLDTPRFKSLRSSRTRFPCSRMKPSRARVYMITTDAGRRCLSARQQYPVADQQKRLPSACRDQPCASRAGRAGRTGLLHLADTWRVLERFNLPAGQETASV